MSMITVIRSIERFIYLIIVYIIPVYTSFRIFKSNDKEKLQKNLHYWVALVILDCVRSIIDPILNRYGVFFFPKIIFFIWFVHPFFSGYEKVYSLVISKFVLPNKERIQNCLEYLHDKQYRYLTFLVQYVMNFFDSCVKQINELIAKKSPSKHIK